MACNAGSHNTHRTNLCILPYLNTSAMTDREVFPCILSHRESQSSDLTALMNVENIDQIAGMEY